MDIAKRLCRMVLGQGILFNADSSAILEALNHFYDDRNLLAKLQQGFIATSLYGRAIYLLGEARDNTLDLQLVSPLQMSRIGRISETEQVADL